MRNTVLLATSHVLSVPVSGELLRGGLPSKEMSCSLLLSGESVGVG